MVLELLKFKDDYSLLQNKFDSAFEEFILKILQGIRVTVALEKLLEKIKIETEKYILDKC